MEGENNTKISKWLEYLQRESWQLELLVSGFTIFLLIQLVSILPGLFPSFNMHFNFTPAIQGVLIMFLSSNFFAACALVFNLLLHIFLRGFWIAAIGLRSVQQNTDFDKLSYSPFFTQKLKQIPSLDRLIIRLDTICSVVFAFAFLVVFMFFSFALWIVFANIVGFLLEFLMNSFEGTFLESFFYWVHYIFFFLLMGTGLIYLIDTLSLGFFKKYERLSKLYYPIYRFLGWITFASIYRSIYYSLVSRFPKNNIRLLLITFIIILIMIPFNRVTFYKYFPDFKIQGNERFAKNAYDNLRTADQRIWTASIPSDVIDAEYFPLFIRYNVRDNAVLDSLCTDYTPTKQSIWVSGLSKTGLRDAYTREKDQTKLLTCLSRLYRVSINDSLYTDLDYYFYQHGDYHEKGIRVMLDTRPLPRGKNSISIKRKRLTKENELIEKEFTTIPFWLEK